MRLIRPWGQLLRQFGLALPLAVVAVAAVGFFRLARQFPAAVAGPALLVPFVRPVLALALEAGAVIALSLAQLRTLAGLGGVAPLARARATLPLLVMLALVVGAAELIPRGTERPGAFANELLETARASCSGSKLVPVPLLGLSVNCQDVGRIEGPMPGVRSVQVAMRQLKFSDDLRRADIAGLELSASRSLRLHLRAASVRVVGLAPWARSPRFSPRLRFAILTALGFALWLPACLGFPGRVAPPAPGRAELAPPRSAPWVTRLFGSLLLAAPGAVVAAGFVTLDQERAGAAAFAGVALLGVATLGLVSLVVRIAPRILASFRGS